MSNTHDEITFAILKPDVVAANKVGQVITRIERAGLIPTFFERRSPSGRVFEELYSEHRDKPFFKAHIDFMVSGPVVPMIIVGPDAVARFRNLMGATNPEEAAPGTLRFDFGTDLPRNAVHGSASRHQAKVETTLFLGQSTSYV